ncbi:hypothetical protein [Bacillus dakarensis]|uniref:hypothetical protein n=1 Tax=Robertmurraya dakarensis TaxID=1926278 RepID=UPI000981E319|nr:hypothetical protein [Bacillus dakarensis]
MKTRETILNAVKYIGGTILTMGIITFLLGFFVSDSITMTSIGIGAVIGATFIFLMGVFFVATDEMLENSDKGIEVVSLNVKKDFLIVKE